MTLAAKPWRIWATRPLEQNQQWHCTLQEQGYQVIDLPLLAIEPVSDPAGVQAVKDLILDFDQFHKVIFVSQNAVHAAFNWLWDYWPQLPSGIEYFAVGSKTAEAAAAHGVQPVAARTTMDTNELMALPQMQQVWGQKVLIMRGRGGLPRMGEILHERGAIVRYCELYLRQLPQEAIAAAAQPLAEEHERTLISLFSGETLHHLDQVLQHYPDVSRNMPLVVPGKRVTDLARSLGFSQIQTAANASEPAMLEAIAHWVDTHP